MRKDLDIYLIRHAQSYQNTGEKYPAGFHADDAPLTDYGKAQADALASYMQEKIDRFYSGTLVRAAQTVYPLALKNKKGIVMLPELREADTAFSGKAQEEIERIIPNAKTYALKESPTGFPLYLRDETQDELKARAKSVSEYILSECRDGEKVVLATHGAFFGYLLRYFLEISLPESFCWQVDNCAITHIRLRKNGIPIVKCANFTGHLNDIKNRL